MKAKAVSLFLMSVMICSLASGCGNKVNDAATEVSVAGSTFDSAQESSAENSDEILKNGNESEGNKEVTESAEKVAADDQENSAEVEADNQDISEEATTDKQKSSENTSDGESSDNGVPILLLHNGSRIEWNEENRPFLKHYYSYLSLESRYAASHSDLAKSLSDARDEIEAHEDDHYTLDMESADENAMYTIESSWYTYLRRADDKYLSFVNECVNAGTFDFDEVSYIAHSYYVDSGKEIELKDIIADEDAFYDALSEKVKKNIDEEFSGYMGEPSSLDKEGVKDRIKTCWSSGRCTWTLDPQGVTFWFDSSAFPPFAFANTVFFSEDKEGTIFKEEFSKNIPDEWVMQMPAGNNTYFDEDDDGEENTVMAAERYELLPDSEYDDLYVTGFALSYEDDYQNYKQDNASGYNFFLFHKDHKNIILEGHYECDAGYITAYLLEDGKIKKADTVDGELEYTFDEAADEEDIAPHYIPTSMDNIRILVDKGNEMSDKMSATLSASTDGKLTIVSEEAE